MSSAAFHFINVYHLGWNNNKKAKKKKKKKEKKLNIFFFFPKLAFGIYMQIVSPGRQFAWNVKPYFLRQLWKEKIPYLPNYSNRWAWANSVDLDQTPPFAASDLGLHRLPHIQHL